jgi:hypothetical protein
VGRRPPCRLACVGLLLAPLVSGPTPPLAGGAAPPPPDPDDDPDGF